MIRTTYLRAFTLVELLVVITIIVVLLALLAPAMDQAIYQAELATCSGRVQAIGRNVQTYAVAHKRAYPYRPVVASGNAYVSQLYHPERPAFDDRKILQPFLPVNTFLIDPLQAPVDLEKSISWTYSSYMLWFGWRYIGSLGGPGSMRIGQGFTYADKKYHLLASDMDWQFANNSHPQVSHPDKAGLLFNVVRQDEGFTLDGVGRFQETKSTWHRPGDRDVIDTNFGYEDGSVIRHIDVVSSAFDSYRGDERMDQINYLRNHSPGYLVQVPRQ